MKRERMLPGRPQPAVGLPARAKLWLHSFRLASQASAWDSLKPNATTQQSGGLLDDREGFTHRLRCPVATREQQHGSWTRVSRTEARRPHRLPPTAVPSVNSSNESEDQSDPPEQPARTAQDLAICLLPVQEVEFGGPALSRCLSLGSAHWSPGLLRANRHGHIATCWQQLSAF